MLALILCFTDSQPLFFIAAALALTLGVLVVLPIGGADMPVVISLLNSATGLAAAATGFVLHSNVLIVSGTLVGASGTLLTQMMGRAMNRSITNVLFGAFGSVSSGPAGEAGPGSASDGAVREVSVTDAAVMLAFAQRVVVVPGYGLAVAQAQHVIRELADLLEARKVDVRYAIHPVAGRMPGHMNVLLAEADVPVPAARRDGRHQPRVPAHRRRARRRRERRDEPGGPDEPRLADLRHADPRGRQGPAGDRAQAVDEARLRGDRQRPVPTRRRASMLFGDAKASLTKLVAEVSQL